MEMCRGCYNKIHKRYKFCFECIEAHFKEGMEKNQELFFEKIKLEQENKELREGLKFYLEAAENNTIPCEKKARDILNKYKEQL